MLHGLCFGEEAGARNLVFFRVKSLQPDNTSIHNKRIRSGGIDLADNEGVVMKGRGDDGKW